MSNSISFKLNGASITITASPKSRLTSILRNELGQIGTKIGCDAGDCGSCTVLIDGAIACACMVPAGQAEGCSVVTVEGVATQTRFGAALQRTFLAKGAVQCGMCTPGMLMSAAALLETNPSANESEIESAIAGVLCRCTGYRKIIAAVRVAAAGL